jgi:hypothetical protein
VCKDEFRIAASSGEKMLVAPSYREWNAKSLRRRRLLEFNRRIQKSHMAFALPLPMNSALKVPKAIIVVRYHDQDPRLFVDLPKK